MSREDAHYKARLKNGRFKTVKYAHDTHNIERDYQGREGNDLQNRLTGNRTHPPSEDWLYNGITGTGI